MRYDFETWTLTSLYIQLFLKVKKTKIDLFCPKWVTVPFFRRGGSEKDAAGIKIVPATREVRIKVSNELVPEERLQGLGLR